MIGIKGHCPDVVSRYIGEWGLLVIRAVTDNVGDRGGVTLPRSMTTRLLMDLLSCSCDRPVVKGPVTPSIARPPPPPHPSGQSGRDTSVKT